MRGLNSEPLPRPRVSGRLALGLLLTLLALAPFIALALWSVSGSWFFPDPWPSSISLRSWSYVLGAEGPGIAPALLQSFMVAGCASLLSVALGAPAGRALGLYDFRGKDLLSIFLMLPVIAPPLAVSMGLSYWFLRLGLAETFIGVTLAHLGFCAPYSIFVMWGVFSNYNPEFEEQARSLGASRLQTALRITLPMTFPGLVVAGLFTFLLSWSQYLPTLIIGGGRINTLPIMLFALIQSGDFSVAATASILLAAPALLILALSARLLGGRAMAGVW